MLLFWDSLATAKWTRWFLAGESCELSTRASKRGADEESRYDGASLCHVDLPLPGSERRLLSREYILSVQSFRNYPASRSTV